MRAHTGGSGRSRLARGISLVETMTVLAVLAVLASMALPSYQSQLAKSRRTEATLALTQLQLAQESFRAHHGSYALRLQGLHGVTPELRHYRLSLVPAGAHGYVARATARDASSLDSGCAELTLTVLDGVARQGPQDTCWGG
jgi:type IV pilus assembly protein PilE